ncbi:MAG: hypothetical protein IKL36_07590 [Clostridia bacterium]|nr:hypothetical protein [Clostridia bacterium]
MKQYFERLSKLGVEAVRGLRQLDAQHVEMQRSYTEDLQKGTITRMGYERYLKDLDKARESYIGKCDAQLEALKAEFSEATDRYTSPSGGNMNMADMEILKNFDLSPKEFENLAHKHENNPTMGRMLEKYRTDHNVETDWRYQTADQRKGIFNAACDSVYFVLKQDDKYSPEREQRIEHNTAKAYHSLQGSIAEVMPIPNAPAPTPGTVISNGTDTATATAVNKYGTVYTTF